MPRTWSIPLFALLVACQPADPKPTPAPAPAKKVESTPPKPTAPPPTPEAAPSEPTETIPEPAPPPPWFSPSAFEHVAIVRQDMAGTKVPSGETSSMIVLELPASTTPEQCIENFKAKLAETVSQPPEASVMPQGHLSLRGKTDTYSYTVVCGIAKDKPTMFLSYVQ